MILVDSRIGSSEVAPYIKKVGVAIEEVMLDFGDFCFEGNGPDGRITIGVERKRLHDMLNCIDDSRYASYQRPGMREVYDKSFLIVEGMWKPHEDGTLMEEFRGGVWGQCKYRSSRVMYAKLRRYLFSISLSGVVVLYTRDIVQTAYDLCELFHYFSKGWDKHTSLLEIQKLAIPDMNVRPSLCRKWASDLNDIGVKFSMEAERLFRRSAIKLATSSELDWLKIKGIGVPTARKIIREINERPY
jgi:ERCC4-type nuclease